VWLGEEVKKSTTGSPGRGVDSSPNMDERSKAGGEGLPVRTSITGSRGDLLLRIPNSLAGSAFDYKKGFPIRGASDENSNYRMFLRSQKEGKKHSLRNDYLKGIRG